MKIALVGEIYSDNLGDGVLAQSMLYLLKQAAPTAEVVTVDLSARSNYPALAANPARSPLKTQVLRLIRTKPMAQSAANVVSWFGKNKARVQEQWMSTIHGADLLVIGGGHLLNDNDLYFPLRLLTLVELAEREKIPVKIYGCSVGDRWSWEGKRLVGQVIDAAKSIALRDSASIERLKANFPTAKSSKLYLISDLALWTPEAFGLQRGSQINPGAKIGINIISPQELYLKSPRPEFTPERLTEFWIEVARLLKQRQIPFTFFSNGASADEIFAEQIAQTVEEALGLKDCPLTPRPKTPSELITYLSEFRSVIVYRMHACVPAIALGIPVVALGWQNKVKAFLYDIDRRSSYYDETFSAEMVLARLWEVEAERENNQSAQTIEKLRNDIRAGVVQLLDLDSR